ncbi:MAG: hypothetical protein EA380_11780 [Phycisphaeraceae bacterium]|nr:MAG: hypothetical protein EA380_11780 [Phycisphaeraceae bacterium]
MRRKAVFLGILLVAMFVFIETVCFFAGRFLRSKAVFYHPRYESTYAEYLELRDPVVGWPMPASFGAGAVVLGEDREVFGGGRDEVGARISPNFPDRIATPPRISVYGDSFAWSAEVDDEYAWPEVLSELVGERVDNFGVGGYGSDQALLRFLHNEHDGSEIVILTHLSENLMRNLSQFRSIYAGSPNGLSFKPRFIPGDDADELVLVPLPTIPPIEYADFVRRPENFLEHDEFVPGKPNGVLRLRFPYSVSVARSFRHHAILARLRREPRYKQFYDPAHSARGTQVTAGILQRFYEETISQSRLPLVVLIPSGLDLEYYRRTQKWPYEPLVDELSVRAVPFLDLGPAMDRAMGNRPVADYYSGQNTSRHNNAAGYALIADLIYDYLVERSYLD